MTEYVGLYLDPVTHDLALDATGNLRLARGREAVAQHAKQRVQFYLGEWFLRTDAGMPWLPGNPAGFAIFDRPFNRGAADALVKAEILGTPGMRELTAYEGRVDGASRGFRVEVEAIAEGSDPRPAASSGEPVRISFSLGFSLGFES